VVGEPFTVTCTLRDSDDNINSSMLRFCVRYPNNSVVAVDDYARVVNHASAQLDYTLQTPSQNIFRTRIKCFLKNSSNLNCTSIRSSKTSTVTAGCK